MTAPVPGAEFPRRSLTASELRGLAFVWWFRAVSHEFQRGRRAHRGEVTRTEGSGPGPGRSSEQDPTLGPEGRRAPIQEREKESWKQTRVSQKATAPELCGQGRNVATTDRQGVRSGQTLFGISRGEDRYEIICPEVC